MSYTRKYTEDAKGSVRAATTAALATNSRSGNVLTASANGALASQDGVSLVVGNRILVKNEATGANNGIYVVTSLGSAGTPWVLTRSFDADGSAELNAGATVPVEEGTVNADSLWILTTNETVTINTTSLLFSRVGGYGASPIGAVSDFAGSSAPSGWLLCYGQNVSRTTYAELFSVISTAFGAGDGSTTFGIPDLRGRFTAALDNMGGVDAGRLSAANTLGTAAGNETAANHTHLSGTYAMPSHSHGVGSYASQAHTHGPGTLGTGAGTNGLANTAVGGTGTRNADPHTHSVTTGATSSAGNLSITGVSANTGPTLISGTSGDVDTSTAGNNLPPYLLLNKIIYAGV